MSWRHPVLQRFAFVIQEFYLEATTSLHSMFASSQTAWLNERQITEDRMPPFHSIIVKRNNTQFYKQFGNNIVADVMYEMFKKLKY